MPAKTAQDRNAIASTATIKSRRATKAGRFYEIIPGDPWPSITTILAIVNKPALVGWSAKVERLACIAAALDMYCRRNLLPKYGADAYRAELEALIGKQKASQKILNEAGVIGTAAHALCEWWIRTLLGLPVGPEPEACDEAQWAFMAFQDWCKEHNFQPRFSEMVVFSRENRFAGTLDILGLVDGVYSIIDIKTGKSIYGEAKLQVSSYRACLASMGLEVPQKAYIVRLPKNLEDPAFEAVEVTDLDSHYQAFLAARQLWQWQFDQSQSQESE